MPTLTGKVAIVTGAAQGLGAAYARALATEGARVAVFDLQSDKAQFVAAEIEGLSLNVDVSDREAVRQAVQEVHGRLGRVDILINNAAFVSTEASRTKPWYELPQGDWERVVNVNLGGCFYGCAAVAPLMIAQGSGKIVNVSSSTFWSPPPQLAHYVATKAGIIGLTRALARELGRHGVNVNAVAPGLTRTEHTASVYPAEYFERVATMRALPRVEETSDLVGTVLYLCSPASDFLTGQTILVDGGQNFD
ncbi:MAG TPA: SDR family oxidoreductase [Chloroflexota bacterium]|nr:SDR family oxidoreductase [Chloroflexota bacterium]